jgi:hypothetical protein
MIHADTYISNKGFAARISVFGCFIMCISVSLCISCMYFGGSSYRFVSDCICMYLHVSAYIMIHGCICSNTAQSCFYILYFSVCMICIACIMGTSLQYLHVLYVLTQTSTQAVTGSSNDPPAPVEGKPADLTGSQSDLGQVSDHFTPRSGTHLRSSRLRSRFVAPSADFDLEVVVDVVYLEILEVLEM